ncbi:hypothetical protein NKH71_10580 [Mesorhizobium sp. M0983]|uniref:hypothetical protein n=1 Tax=unclassified Mesorhizobium TaxID=325217 RepID=UPI00333D2DB4
MQRLFAIPTFFGVMAGTMAVAAPFTYTNERFGTVCTFPDEIFTLRQPEPDNGDGQQWLTADGASLICSGILNIDDETPTAFVSAERASKELGYKITYSKTGKDWAVLSGIRTSSTNAACSEKTVSSVRSGSTIRQP